MNDLDLNGKEAGLSGMYAALITPVTDSGRPDPTLLTHLIDFTVNRGVNGLCLGGGTAEYPHFQVQDRKHLVEVAARHLNGRVPIITAIGAPTFRDVIDLGKHAIEMGSTALLLPMPFFYHYTQDDLAAYVREAARQLDAPCVLYNLSGFTNPLARETSISLLRSVPNLIGIKDSSGNRDALAFLHDARKDLSTSLICGSDGLLFEALEAGWDGGISGIASCCPEVLVSLYAHYRAGRIDKARDCQRRLDELVELVGRLPFPWSIRAAAEVRGLKNGPLPYPLSDSRRSEMRRLREEYEMWFDRNLPALVSQERESQRG